MVEIPLVAPEQQIELKDYTIRMKANLFVIMTVLCLLCSPALAQAYAIRVASNTNLRAAPSLDANVVTSARAGAILQVTGAFNRWLKISHNGGDTWMADWVSYTRVETSPQAPAQSPSAAPVDNCCFVDRECHSDQDWTDGYWAFQNMQCAAPAPVQAPAPAQSAGGAPAQADNCCFTGWHCATDADWAAGFHAFQTNQCDHPGIAIEGSPGFVRQMHNALDMLRDRAPYWYDYVLRGLDGIRQTPPEVIGVHVAERVFDLDYSDEPPVGISLESHATHDAAMLVHEACHVYRYEAGLEAGGLDGESACVEAEIQALEFINPNSRWIQFYSAVLSNIHRPECQWWWGEYRSCGES